MAVKCVIFFVALNVLYVTCADTKIEFEKESVTVREGVGTVKLTVVRSGKVLAAPTEVRYSTKNGSAKARTDYIGDAGVLKFEAGEERKTISVTIIDDKVQEDEVFFTVELIEVTANSDAVELGKKNVIKVTIQ